MKECLFYLNTYGTHQSLLAFYIKHNSLGKAVRMVVDKVPWSRYLSNTRCLRLQTNVVVVLTRTGYLFVLGLHDGESQGQKQSEMYINQRFKVLRFAENFPKAKLLRTCTDLSSEETCFLFLLTLCCRLDIVRV